MEKFAFVIAHRYIGGDANGELAAYTLHNQTVFNGDADYAKGILERVNRCCDKEEKYEIYKLV